jgi:hypothetical protein
LLLQKLNHDDFLKTISNIDVTMFTTNEWTNIFKKISHDNIYNILNLVTNLETYVDENGTLLFDIIIDTFDISGAKYSVFYFELTKYFISRYKNANLQHYDDRTIMHYVCMGSFLTYDLLKYCIEKGCNMESTDVDNIAPIHNFCYNSLLTLEMLEYIIHKKININLPGELHYMTPIAYLIHNENITNKIIKYFIDNINPLKNKDIRLVKYVCRNMSLTNVYYYLKKIKLRPTHKFVNRYVRFSKKNDVITYC